MPVVSVLIVFHRDTPFLRPTIRSVLDQTFQDFELLLIDNGLGLAAGALGEIEADPRVRKIKLPSDEGIGVATNAGVASARGEFIAIQDYDDLSVPHRLEQQVAALRTDPELGLVSALADRIDASGRSVEGNVFTLTDPATFCAYAQFGAPVIHPVMMGRREVFLSFPFRSHFRFTSELDFYSRVTERWRAAVLPEVLLHYRYYGNQTTQKHAAAIERDRCTINVVTARRRGGRDEKLDELSALATTLSPAEYCRWASHACAEEGFFETAAYLARRSFAHDRSFTSAMSAARLGFAAWRRATAEKRGLIARLFFTGPVNTLGLKPA